MPGCKGETPKTIKTYTLGSVDCTPCFDQGRLNSIVDRGQSSTQPLTGIKM